MQRARYIARVVTVMASLLTSAAHACDFVFDNGMETPEYPSISPSGGCSGAYPGRFTMPLNGLPGDIIVQIPHDYRPQQSIPLLFVLHGAAGPGQASNQAHAMMDLWQEVVEHQSLIAVALIGTSPNGSWFVSDTELMLQAAAQQIADTYNVDLARVYGWGFSAGGHVMHSLALDDIISFAGYGVSAGALAAAAGLDAPMNALTRTPAFLSVGQFDSLYGPVTSDFQIFVDAGWIDGLDLDLYVFPGGHAVGFDAPERTWAFLREHTR